MRLQSTGPQIRWQTLDDWTRVCAVWLDKKTGLLRFKRENETVYIGMESVSLLNYSRFSRPKGSARKHAGGQLVYRHRHELTLQYAILDLPRSELKRLRNRLREKHSPAFNFPEPSFTPRSNL